MLAVIIEADPDGAASTASLEVLAIAQALQEPVALVAGPDVERITAELASFALTEIVAFEAPQLHQGNSPALVSALTSWIRDAQPDLVLAPHSYAARDYLPRLAARLDQPLVTDCL